MVAAVVGVPVFFILMITLISRQDKSTDLNSLLEQIASYQLIGVLWSSS
jgi:hypothetical protein